MSPDEIGDAYPTIRHLVYYVESILCDRGEEGESCWDIILTRLKTPREVANLIAEMIQEDDTDSVIPAIVWEALRREVRLPAFQTYIAGKMGAV